MNIEYREQKEYTEAEIERLFLSVGWESGKFPSEIVKGLKNSTTVISAWDGSRLVGLIRGLDDGYTIGFIHYVLVDPEYQGQHIGNELMRRLMDKYRYLLHVKVMPSDPKTLNFYRRFGFEVFDNYTAMEINHMH